MKTIFITGASSGIGRETTKFFASQGWQVVATMRNLKKAGELETLPNVAIMPLDVTNPEQIHETCQKALATYDVDVLLNNAGLWLSLNAYPNRKFASFSRRTFSARCLSRNNLFRNSKHVGRARF